MAHSLKVTWWSFCRCCLAIQPRPISTRHPRKPRVCTRIPSSLHTASQDSFRCQHRAFPIPFFAPKKPLWLPKTGSSARVPRNSKAADFTLTPGESSLMAKEAFCLSFQSLEERFYYPGTLLHRASSQIEAPLPHYLASGCSEEQASPDCQSGLKPYPNAHFV